MSEHGLNAVSKIMVEGPANFKFIIDGKLAGMSKFDDNCKNKKIGEDEKLKVLVMYAQYLKTQNITAVISIEEDGHELTRKAVEKVGIKWYSCFLEDWNAPSVNQLKAYCETVANNEVVATHCHGGTGRTACFLASYLLHTEKAKNAQEALKMVRVGYSIHSVEIKAQYNALARYSDSLENEPSMSYKDDQFKGFEANGHWHEENMNDGMFDDPGHEGDKAEENFTGNINEIAINYNGNYVAKGPFIGPKTSKLLSMQLDPTKYGSSGAENVNDDMLYHLQGVMDAFALQAKKVRELEEKVDALTCANGGRNDENYNPPRKPPCSLIDSSKNIWV